MSNTDKTPPEDSKESPASTVPVVVEKRGGVPAIPESALRPRFGAVSAEGERSRISSWSRAAIAPKALPGAAQIPALPPPSPVESSPMEPSPTAPNPVAPVPVESVSELAASEDIGAPFVETIALSFSESQSNPSAAKPEAVDDSPQPAEEPVAEDPVEKPAEKNASADASSSGAPTMRERAARLRKLLRLRKSRLKRGFKTGLAAPALQRVAAIQWPQGQALARTSSRMMTQVRQYPLRPGVRVAVVVAAICGAGFLLERSLARRSAPVGGETPPATIEHFPIKWTPLERVSASIETPGVSGPEPKSPEPKGPELASPEVSAPPSTEPEVKTPEPEAPGPKAPEPVLDSASPPAGVAPVAAPIENAPEPKETPGLRAEAGGPHQDARDNVVEARAEAPVSDAVAVAPAKPSEAAPPSDIIVIPSTKSSGESEPAPQATPNSQVAEPFKRAAKPADAKDVDGTEVGFKAALVRGKATKDKRLIATASGELGAIFYKRGELDAAEAAFRQSLVLYEELSSTDDALKEGAARMSNALGRLHRDRGHLDKAEKMFNKAAAIDKALGRNAELASDYTHLGQVFVARKKLDLAEHAYLDALRLQQALKANEGIASSYASLGQIYFTHGDLNKAVEMFKKAITVENAGSLKRGIGMDYSNLGVVYAKRRDFVNACACWRKARRLLQEAGMTPELGRVQRALREEACAQVSEASGPDSQ
jgi:tetratricopeptide (TPR) repeat protein